MKAGIVDHVPECFYCKNLAPCGQYHFFHVFPTYTKAPAADTGYHLVFGLVLRASRNAEFAKMLNACHFVSGSAVIFCDFCFDNNLRIKFAGNNEIGRLVKSLDPFRAFRFADAYSSFRKNILYGRLKTISY